MKEYFSALNYTLGNEDTSLELSVMPQNINHAFIVAGSGSRVIPLLSKNPKNVTCVDLSQKQIFYTQLKIATLKELDYQKYLAFWEYPPFKMKPDERKKIFKNLSLPFETKKEMEAIFQKQNWNSILLLGKWEKTFNKLSKINRLIVGKKGLEIFSCKTKKEQQQYLKEKFPHKAWSLSVFLLGNATLFNTLLYRGNFPKKNIPQTMNKFYLEKFEHLFNQDIAQKNYFLQLLFLGKLVYPQGLPIECNEEIFLKAKESIQKTKVTYICNDVITEAKKTNIPIDFLSFSDIPSYLKPPLDQSFMQEIKDKISSGGIIINRYYLKIPKNLNTKGFLEITEKYKEEISKEKIQVYSFGIYKKI